MGLITARSQVLRFEDEIAIVVERYDRRWTGTGFLRGHQEDICQALGLAPSLKYENEGGPRPAPSSPCSARFRDGPRRTCTVSSMPWLSIG